MSALVLGAVLATAPMSAFAGTLTMNLGSTVATMDENTIVMQNAAFTTKEGIVMVPVRAVAEAYGGTVVYDGEANTVRMDFPSGQWAVLEVQMPGTATDIESDELYSIAKFIDDRMYIPADIMALCIGGTVCHVDYESDHVWRLIYHVR